MYVCTLSMHASNILTPCRVFCYPTRSGTTVLTQFVFDRNRERIHSNYSIPEPSGHLHTKSSPQKTHSAPVSPILSPYTTASTIQRTLESFSLAVHSTRITTYIWTTQRHSRILPATTRSRFQDQLSPSGYLHTFGLEAKGTRKLI